MEPDGQKSHAPCVTDSHFITLYISLQVQNFLQTVRTESDPEKTAASVLDRTGDENPQECKETQTEEFREATLLGEHGEREEHFVDRQPIVTNLEPEPEQDMHVPSDCNEQDHRRELVPLDIPDFLHPDAPEDENGG